MFCRNCGKEYSGSPQFCLGCGARPLQGSQFCEWCGVETSAAAGGICVKCGGAPTVGPSRDASSAGLLTAGGVLAIICGAFGIIYGVLYAALGGVVSVVFDFSGVDYIVTGVVEVTFGILAIVGGACAVKRKHFPLAVVGGVFSILAGGMCCVGLPLGVPALVLIAVSKEKFKDRERKDSHVL